jgi:hypothetical protein
MEQEIKERLTRIEKQLAEIKKTKPKSSYDKAIKAIREKRKNRAY